MRRDVNLSIQVPLFAGTRSGTRYRPRIKRKQSSINRVNNRNDKWFTDNRWVATPESVSKKNKTSAKENTFLQRIYKILTNPFIKIF